MRFGKEYNYMEKKKLGYYSKPYIMMDSDELKT